MSDLLTRNFYRLVNVTRWHDWTGDWVEFTLTVTYPRLKAGGLPIAPESLGFGSR